MKIHSLLSLVLTAFCGVSYSQQCPGLVLKIESPVCDTPKNLQVTDINCKTVKLTWQGNQQQKYVIEATGTDNIDHILFAVKEAKYNCDNNGSCSATINVKEGATFNWNVQAICNINGATVYSPKVAGNEIVIPSCNAITARQADDINNEAIRVFPNPTRGNLTVEYYSKIAGALQLQVFDAAGKSVFARSVNASTGGNHYNLDLHTLTPGTYVLKLTKANRANQVKIVLVGK